MTKRVDRLNVMPGSIERIDAKETSCRLTYPRHLLWLIYADKTISHQVSTTKYQCFLTLWLPQL